MRKLEKGSSASRRRTQSTGVIGKQLGSRGEGFARGWEGRFEDDLPLAAPESEDLVALDHALNKLSAIDERQSRIVELRFFGGLTIGETASLLDISEKTVKRDLGARQE